jgi:putative transposase
MSQRHRSSDLLLELAELVVEAALEAEMVEHLAVSRQQPPQRGRRNSRNGSRAKTVRSLVGPLTIDVPRDRWGTFQPVTVGKWQRQVVGLDRVLLPLVAKGAPRGEVVDLLQQAFPPDASPTTLGRIAEMVRERLRQWHDRMLPGAFPVLHVHLSTMRTHQGQVAGFPILSVVGVTAPDGQGAQRRELLSLHAMQPDRGAEPWVAVARDLQRRNLTGVQSVVGAAATPFRHAAARVWASADEGALSA